MKNSLLGLALATMIMSCTNSDKDTSGFIPKPEPEITDGKMTAEVLLSLGRLSDPQLSPDGKNVLYGVSYTSIEENRSCRNLFVCKADGTSEAFQITKEGKSVSNARWSKDGKSVFFIQDGQLWKAPYNEGMLLGKKEKLSDIPNGISEFKLSPDQNMVLFISTQKNEKVQRPTDVDPRLDKADAYVTEDLMYRHWDHWVTDTPRSYVGILANGTITPEGSLDILGGQPWELPTEPFGGVEQLDWAPDGRHIAYSCRKLSGKQYAFSTNTDIFIYDILTGAEINVSNGGGYDTDPVWSPDGSKLAWIRMERDGYEADAQWLMVCDIKTLPAETDGQNFGLEPGATCRLASELDRDAAGIFWMDDSKTIVFNALTDGVQALYSVKSDGSEPAVRITPKDWNYDFFSPFAYKDGEFLASYYCLSFPAELVRVKADGSSFERLSHENDAIFGKLDDISTESVWLETVDRKQMQCWVVYPPKFDPSKQYPAIEIVLGGPQGSNSQDWSYRWCYRLMAQQGYVVILPNRRGTTAFGQEWKEEISGDYCGLNMQDYLTAGRWMKSQPWVGKLACVGASYGGYSAYMLEGLHGDLYDCFIAHAGIFDEAALWYTTEEMWFANWDNGGLTEYAYTEGETGPRGDGITFGGMQQAGAPYASTPKAQRHYANSPASMITKWHTPILCIHGCKDFRIPYEQGMAAFNAAQMMGVPSKLVIFPEECHWVLGPQNSMLWHREVYDWLDRWMK